MTPAPSPSKRTSPPAPGDPVILQRAPYVNPSSTRRSIGARESGDAQPPLRRSKRKLGGSVGEGEGTGGGGGGDGDDLGEVQQAAVYNPDDNCPRNAKNAKIRSGKRSSAPSYSISPDGEFIQETEKGAEFVDILANGIENEKLRERLSGLACDLSGKSYETDIRPMLQQDDLKSIVHRLHSLDKKMVALQFTTFIYKVLLVFKVDRCVPNSRNGRK